MPYPLKELKDACEDLASGKVQLRSRAVKKLNDLLSIAKTDIIRLYSNTDKPSFPWDNVFESVVSAIAAHSLKVFQAQGTKTYSTLQNLNYAYTAVAQSIVDYGAEVKNMIIGKTTVVQSFKNLYRNQVVVFNFRRLSLQILERAVFDVPDNLKLLDYGDISEILLSLFEFNEPVEVEDQLAVMRMINRTLEISQQRLQVSCDYKDYFEKVKIFAEDAEDEAIEAEVVKMFYLFTKELLVDYNIMVCKLIQQILPLLCAYYSFHMRTDIKTNFFMGTYWALKAIYPNISKGDCNPVGTSLRGDWIDTLHKVMATIEVEAKERSMQIQTSANCDKSLCHEYFIKVAAMALYIIHWGNCDFSKEGATRPKIPRTTDYLETVLATTTKDNTTILYVRLEIFTQLIIMQPHLINLSNYVSVVNAYQQFFLMPNCWENLRCLRLGISTLLHVESKLFTVVKVESEKWAKIVEILVTRSMNASEMVREKHMLVQLLVRYNKLSQQDCSTFLNFLFVSNSMRRNEYVATLREIMRYHVACGLEKTPEMMEKLLNWLYNESNRIDGRGLLLDIDPLNQELVADTSALMVINFVDTYTWLPAPKAEELFQPEEEEECKQINYRYCRKYTCIEVYGKELREAKPENKIEPSKCLIQSNYNLLMRLLNFEITAIQSFKDIHTDLLRLIKMVYSMRKLFDYNIFDQESYETCPLVKRIGLFLDNIDFQLTNMFLTSPKSDVSEVLDLMLEIFTTMSSSPPFLDFLSKRRLPGTIDFIVKVLKYYEMLDKNGYKHISLAALNLLSTLCSSHAIEVLPHLEQYDLIAKLDAVEILQIIEIFTKQHSNNDVGQYLISMMEFVCKRVALDIEISSKIIRMLPDISRYVEPYPDLLHSVIVAISSYLKLSKKKYPVYFVARLIDAIRYIVRCCPNLIVNEDYADIFIDLPIFLKSPNDPIAMATVNTITALMDLNWTAMDPPNMRIYFAFCKKLYDEVCLAIKDLPTEYDDVQGNTYGIVVQMLVSLFAFSAFHQAEAFKNLAYYCADWKIEGTYFQQFVGLPAFFNCSLKAFTKPFVEPFVYAWCKKKQPMIRFPYYLFAESLEKFISTNLAVLSYYHLRLYITGIGELEHLKYGTKHELVMKALPLCHAFLLNHLSGNLVHPSDDYKAEVNYLLGNLKDLSIDLKSYSHAPHWQTLQSIIRQLWDGTYSDHIFGFSVYLLTPPLSVGKDVIHEYLRFYLNGCYDRSGTIDECFQLMIRKDPITLLSVLTAFKYDSCQYQNVSYKFTSFYYFCSLADIVVHSVSRLVPSFSASNTHTFFLRDILFFLLSVVSKPKVDSQVLTAGIHFINYILDLETFKDVIKKYLNNITCILMKVAENNNADIESQAISILEKIICHHTEDFYDAIKLLGKFPDAEPYRKLYNTQQTISYGATGLRAIVLDFLKSHTKDSIGIKALKKSIAEHKGELESLSNQGEMSTNLLYDLLKQLIDVVRDDNQVLALEAAKCLGEISATRIKDVSFYFECDTTFYNMESAYQNEMDFFAESFYRVLDKLLLNYDPISSVTLSEVCKDLVNSRIGKRVLKHDSFSLFKVFVNKDNPIRLDNYSSIAPFSFVDIVIEYEALAYETWVKAFSSKIFNLCKWDSFGTLCQINFSFSESAIIPMFKMFLASKEIHFNNIVKMLEHFFMRTFETIKNEEWRSSRLIYSDKKVIKYFLNICECIRIHNNWVVPINMLHVAEACVYCEAHFMGILYSELWAMVEKDKDKSKTRDIVRNETFQGVATQAYKSINCTEAISGFLNPFTSRLEYLSLEGDWAQVLLELDSSNELKKSLCVENLKRNGLLALSSCEKVRERPDYECCWRLGQWDTPIESVTRSGSLNDLEYEFEKNHFLALKSIFNREEVNCLSAVNKAQKAVISILQEISIENLQNIYKYITWLHLLQQTEDFCQIQFGLSSQPERILEKWNLEQNIKYGNFQCTEIILSHQMTLYKLAGVRAGRKIDEFFKERSAVGECILKCIDECKNAGNLNLAIRNVALLKTLETSKQFKAKALLEDADISWKSGKTRMAKEILRNIMMNSDFALCLERIQAHRMYGEMLLETNDEAFDVVHKESFLRSMELLSKYSEHKDRIALGSNEFEAYDAESRKSTFLTIAKYADKEYTQLNTYLHSETFRTKVHIMKKNKEEVESFDKKSSDRDRIVGKNLMIRNCGIDGREIKLMETKRLDNLFIALENYKEFSKLDNTITSSSIYRIIALWFAHKSDPALNKIMKSIINEIPTFKFICVLNQMSARLSDKNPQFLEILEELLVKCVGDHPHHTLYKLLALAFAYADNPKSSSTSSPERVIIARKIVHTAKAMKPDCVIQMESMFSALIDFANKDAGKDSSLVLSDKMRTLKDLEHVHCPTIDLPVSISRQYDIIYIRKWENSVDLVGGINAPKKLMCVCSDGVKRPQLLKGKDDLRQDEVMQQVLTMVNDLLKNDPETNEQNLLLRTYRIVPLSMRSGILEWCKNTVPFGLYLCGDKKNEGAHKKYRPSDYTVAKCRTLAMASNEALKKKGFDDRLKTYLHICERIKPVFHYFFFEKFLVPGIWFERRLAYTKSVATTSIVGFILGLGDRHVQNILIDELTAEIIHIDFGIAFEQGKIMPTPETVPFRLTRDIVAPMGISGADGVFQKICEKTMKILRKNHVFLTTILEVLLYDPLYVWSLASQKSLDNSEDPSSEEKNLTAQRALLRVQEKLEGREEGKVGTSSIEVQVQRLINEAMNDHNLCRLYPGWDPYL